MQIISAKDIALSKLHAAMQDAYSDYAVPMQFDLAYFEMTLRMRGFRPDLSQLAMEEGEVASFWLIGVEPEARPGAAYAITVGTRIAHRRRGLAQKLYKELVPHAQAANLNHCVLEVIEGNDKAVELYEGLGFDRLVRVECFKGAPPTEAATPAELAFQSVSVNEAHEAGKSFCDWRPTWQNDTPAMEHIADNIEATIAAVDGKPVGFGMVNFKSGSITQFAVDPKWRRKGIAKSMLAHWSKKHDLATLSTGNVPDTDKAAHAFFLALGWQNDVNQLVMRAGF